MKQKIIDLVTKPNARLPNKFLCPKQFDGLKLEELSLFKECFDEHKAVTFTREHLFAEEQAKIDAEMERHEQALQDERDRLDAEFAKQLEKAKLRSLTINSINRELHLLNHKDNIANTYFELQRRNLNEAVQRSTWVEIEAQDYTIRGQTVLKTKVLPGDLITTPYGVEVYEGVEQAGYRTSGGLYECLAGFSLKAKNYPEF